jgi:hypothetical protein
MRMLEASRELDLPLEPIGIDLAHFGGKNLDYDFAT